MNKSKQAGIRQIEKEVAEVEREIAKVRKEIKKVKAERKCICANQTPEQIEAEKEKQKLKDRINQADKIIKLLTAECLAIKRSKK